MNRLTIRRITPAYAGKSRLAGADFCRVMWITPAYAGKINRQHVADNRH